MSPSVHDLSLVFSEYNLILNHKSFKVEFVTLKMEIDFNFNTDWYR